MKTKSKDAVRLGKRIREVRQSRGLSLTAFARLAEMDKGHLCRVELGVNEPGLPMVRKLAKLLGVPFISLFSTPTKAA